jgi:hypothetical protein
MVNEQPSHTVGSAIVLEGNYVAFKEIRDGKDDGKLSLLGGYLNWREGFPFCLASRIYDENGITFAPQQLRMVQTTSASGRSLLNLNVTGPVTDRTYEKQVVWLDWRDALRRPEIFRTQDTLSLLRMQSEREVVDMNFVQTTRVPGGRIPIPDYNNPLDFVVTSGVIRSLEDGRYAFAIAGKGERTPGKIGLLGGRFEGSVENLFEGNRRELLEEGGLRYNFPAGMAGLLVTPRAGRRAVSNLVMAYEVPDRDCLTVPESAGDEVGGIVWMSLGDVLSMPRDTLRSGDVTSAVSIAAYRSRRGNLVPYETVHVVG